MINWSTYNIHIQCKLHLQILCHYYKLLLLLLSDPDIKSNVYEKPFLARQLYMYIVYAFVFIVQLPKFHNTFRRILSVYFLITYVYNKNYQSERVWLFWFFNLLIKKLLSSVIQIEATQIKLFLTYYILVTPLSIWKDYSCPSHNCNYNRMIEKEWINKMFL